MFQRLYGGASFEGADYFGALSWRFTEKTGLTGQALIEVVRSNPEVDLFYMNPFPHNEAIPSVVMVARRNGASWVFGGLHGAFFEAAGLEIHG